jgi:hypothetical protein
MVLLDTVKNKIMNMISQIVELEDEYWSNLDINIKLKYIHHFCSCISNINKNVSEIEIPLKSLKPKKLINFSNFTKSINTELFKNYQQNILNYTFQFRDKYIKKDKRIYYNYSNLPNKDYNTILNEYNNIVYTFLKNNFDKININNLFDFLTESNNDKLFINNKNLTLQIESLNNIIILKFSNDIIITFKLFFNSNMITNNIPVFYQINLKNII